MATTFGYLLIGGDPTANEMSESAKAEFQKSVAKVQEYVAKIESPCSWGGWYLDGPAARFRWLEDRKHGQRLIRGLQPGDHVVLADLLHLGSGGLHHARGLGRLLRAGVTVHVLGVGRSKRSFLLGPGGGANQVASYLQAQVACIRAYRGMRTREGMAKRRRNGRPLNRNPVYGYRREVRSDGVRLVPCPAEVDCMRRIVVWRMAGRSCRWILGELQAAKATTADGGEWTLDRVRNVERWVKKGRLEGAVGEVGEPTPGAGN